MGILGLGLGGAPLFMMAQAVSPTIIPTALALSTAVFGGASLVAYNMPKDKMLGMGGVLMGSLLGLIGLQVIGLLTAAFTGPNALSTLLFSANNYLGIGLFSALIAYDTHVAIKMYELREADHLGMAVQFLLNFWNILLRFVSIFSNREWGKDVKGSFIESDKWWVNTWFTFLKLCFFILSLGFNDKN